MEGILWALACLHGMYISFIQIETDFSDFVNMIENPVDRKAFSTEHASFHLLNLSFKLITLVYILKIRQRVSIARR